MRRRLVGGALRRYREHMGYALEDAARVLDCDRSKISRIETGQRGIRPKELRELRVAALHLIATGVPMIGKKVSSFPLYSHINQPAESVRRMLHAFGTVHGVKVEYRAGVRLLRPR